MFYLNLFSIEAHDYMMDEESLFVLCTQRQNLRLRQEGSPGRGFFWRLKLHTIPSQQAYLCKWHVHLDFEVIKS